jgi:hypothetical protein
MREGIRHAGLSQTLGGGLLAHVREQLLFGMRAHRIVLGELRVEAEGVVELELEGMNDGIS